MPLKNLQDTILEHCWAQRGKCSQEASKRYCSVFLRPARKISLGGFQDTILEHFWAQRGKCHQEANRIPFWTISRRISGPSTENVPRKPQGQYFKAFLNPARKMLPGSFQDTILEHFCAQRGKCSQEASRTLFWSISAPSAENLSRRFPGHHFGTFLSPAWKMLPGSQ